MNKSLNITLVCFLGALSLVSAFYLWSPLLVTREENPVLFFTQDVQSLKNHLDQKYGFGVRLASIALFINWLVAANYLFRTLKKAK